MKKDRIGEKHITNEGYEVEIIKYFNWKNCTIKFNDCNNTVLEQVVYNCVINGNIKNPFHKSVCNIGYFGQGIFKHMFSNKRTKVSVVWRNMLQRCYCAKIQEKNITYKDCSVDERWHNFQNFAQWHEENYNPETMKGWHLDKDILVKGNKIYSPETCCFVPHEINNLFTKSNIIRGEYPIGVHYKTKINKHIAQYQKNGVTIYIGAFNTFREAFQAYKEAKENYIKEVADKWKDLISLRVYVTLYNYKVEITD